MKKQKLTHRGTVIGDMRHRIFIHERNIHVPAFGSVDFDERFTGFDTWAAIRTTGGKVVFDGVGQDALATHEVFVRYNEDYTTQNFVQVDDGRRFRILSVEDYDERHDYMVMLCTDRGFDEAAKA